MSMRFFLFFVIPQPQYGLVNMFNSCCDYFLYSGFVKLIFKHTFVASIVRLIAVELFQCFHTSDI